MPFVLGNTNGVKHGHSPRKGQSPTYNSWCGMKHRCTDLEYQNYGGRGITVCDRWLKFENFFEDMGERPEGMTLDRIDNDGDYKPGNCRWATRKEQHRNRSDNHLLTFKGETHCMSEWAEVLRVPRDRIRGRIRNGWTVERTLTEK